MQSSVTGIVASRLAEAARATFPPEALEAAELHILDTVAAILSGSTLPAGLSILAYAKRCPRLGENEGAHVVGTQLRPDHVTAARINGMLAHADESDDSHQRSLTHPGCAVIPAALAAAEATGSAGLRLLRGVVAGYELTARVSLAMGPDFKDTRGSKPSSHAIGGVFGAAAAAAVIARHEPAQVAHVISFASQSAAGTTTWLRDRQHVEKAYVFGGLPAGNGALAAFMVSAGLPAVDDVFDQSLNFLHVHSPNPDTAQLTSPWGQPWAVCETNFKRYPVGSPAQAAVQAAEELSAAEPIPLRFIRSVRIHLPPEAVHVVDAPATPNLNVRFLVASALIDRRLTFNRAHDQVSMRRHPYQKLLEKSDVVPCEELTGGRGCRVEVALKSGAIRVRQVDTPYGTSGNPMTKADVIDKAHDLMAPVIGPRRARQVCENVQQFHKNAPVNELLRLTNTHQADAHSKEKR